MPQEIAATWSTNGVLLQHVACHHPLDAMMQRHPAAGDRGGAGAAVGLEDIAIHRDLALAERGEIDRHAQRPADQPLDLLGAAGLLAARRLAPHALGGGARQHAVFRRHPAAPQAAQPRRHPVLERGGAQHVGVAEAHQARALGMPGDARFQADGADFVGRTSGGAHGSSFEAMWVSIDARPRQFLDSGLTIARGSRWTRGCPAWLVSISARATSFAAWSRPIWKPASRWARGRSRASCRSTCRRPRCATSWPTSRSRASIFAPHTSAGRLPTELGLRFFVDSLLDLDPLSLMEQAQIDAGLAAAFERQRRLDDVLSDATNMLSGLSHCAGLVLTSKINVRLRHIDFVDLGPGKALVVLVGEDGTVENRAIEVPHGLPVSSLVMVSNYLNRRFQGRTLPEMRRIVHQEVEHVKRELDEVSARVVEAGLATWVGAGDDVDEKTLIVRGQANLIEDSYALEDLERIRRLFEDLETKKDLIQLVGLAEEGEGVRIFIGSENKLFSLSGSSLVVAPYHDTEQNIIGVLGVIGPTRLNYARIIPIVEYTARAIGRVLMS
jgi:heat-inducible transcriptional repressor